MRSFLQISLSGTDNIIATWHLFCEHINTYHLLRLRASEIKKRIRSDILARRLTWYFSWFSKLNERFSSNM